MTVIPLSREKHVAMRLRTGGFSDSFRNLSVLAVYGAEMARVAHEFPVCFIAESEGYFPAALMGIEAAKNLFIDAEGKWLAGYMPAIMRRAPFVLAKVGDTSDWVVCVDEESPLLSYTEGQPLFDEEGQPTPLVGQVTAFLTDLERHRIATAAACAAIDRHGLLEPWELIVQDGAENRRLDGLFKIEESRMASLPAEALADLRDQGGLPLIYAHLLSLGKLPLLGRLAIIHREAEAKSKAKQMATFDLDRAFGIIDEDPFQF